MIVSWFRDGDPEPVYVRRFVETDETPADRLRREAEALAGPSLTVNGE